jgi:hypothetical protein
VRTADSYSETIAYTRTPTYIPTEANNTPHMPDYTLAQRNCTQQQLQQHMLLLLL